LNYPPTGAERVGPRRLNSEGAPPRQARGENRGALDGRRARRSCFRSVAD